MGVIVLIAVVVIIAFVFKSRKQGSSSSNAGTSGQASSRPTEKKVGEVEALLLSSPYYQANKPLFDSIKCQPQYKVEWLLQSLELGHEIESNGYYIFKSIENQLPYFLETETEFDTYYKKDCPAYRGYIDGLLDMCFLYSGYSEHSHPAKLKYWQDQILQRAEAGDLVAQGGLCSNYAKVSFSPETVEAFQEKYKEVLIQKAQTGVDLAQLAVGEFLTPHRSKECIEWLSKAATQGLSDAWWHLSKAYSAIITLDDEGNARTKPLPNDDKGELEQKIVECYLCGAEADNGVMAGYCQYLIAGYYENGEHHLPKDLQKAEYWYRKAIEHDVDGAEQNLEWLLSHNKIIAEELTDAKNSN